MYCNNLVGRLGRALFLTLAMAGLAGCLDSSSDDTRILLLPDLGLDFPPQEAVVLSYSTDDEDVDISGITLGTTTDSIPDSLEIVLNDGDEDNEVVIDTIPNPGLATFFYWRGALSDASQSLLPGLNTVGARTSGANGSFSRAVAVVRGTSYMREVAIVHYHPDADENIHTDDQWYVLDVAKKAVLAITAPAFDSPDEKVEKTVFSQNGDATPSTVDFQRPVDFALDAARNRLLVADRDLGQIVAVSLLNGGRSTVAGITVTEPIAIEVNADTAWIIDAADTSIHSVDLTLDTSTLLPDNTLPGDEAALQLPQDLVYQPAVASEPDRLFVSDRRIVPGEADQIIIVNAATGDRNLMLQPEQRDSDEENSPNFQFGTLGRLALHGEILYAIDDGYGGILAIDVSGDYSSGTPPNDAGTEGSWDTFSSFLTIYTADDETVLLCDLLDVEGDLCPGLFNQFLAAHALGLGEDALGNDRLLVLDNNLSSVVEVEINDADTLGQRNYLPGGRSLSGSQPGEDPAEGAHFSIYHAEDPLLANRQIKTAIGQSTVQGTSFFAIDSTSNSLLEIPVSGAVGVTLSQIQSQVEVEGSETGEIDEDASRDATEARVLLDARTLAYQPQTNEFYIVDAASDRVIAHAGTGAAVRDIASEAASSSVSFLNPIDSAIYLSSDTIDDSVLLSDETLFYVLDQRGPGDFDLVEIDVDLDPAQTEFHRESVVVNNRRELEIPADCNFVDPVSMAYYTEEGETIGGLLIGNRTAAVLHWVDLASAEDPFVPVVDSCTDLPFTAPTAGFDIADIVLDLRSGNAQQPAVLLLDKANQEVFRVNLDLDANTATADTDPLTGPGQPDNANLFVSANSMLFAENNERLYVLDDITHSVYLVDLATRDPATGERIESGDVSGQRVVTYRGTALDCDPDQFAEPDACDVERPEPEE